MNNAKGQINTKSSLIDETCLNGKARVWGGAFGFRGLDFIWHLSFDI
jgi:hypothetical protein